MIMAHAWWNTFKAYESKMEPIRGAAGIWNFLIELYFSKQ